MKYNMTEQWSSTVSSLPKQHNIQKEDYRWNKAVLLPPWAQIVRGSNAGWPDCHNWLYNRSTLKK